MLYLVKRGRINRYEKGVLARYEPGRTIELTDKEAIQFAALIGPVPTLATTKANTPVMRHVVPVSTFSTHERDLREDFSPPPSDEEKSGIAFGEVDTTTSPLERSTPFHKKDRSQHNKE